MTTHVSAAFGALDTPARLTPDEIDARARALAAELTFEEKLGLKDGDLPFWKGLARMGAPQGYSREFWVAGAVERLGLPGIRFVDGPRGVIMDGATTFPVSMARGATFDPELENRVGDVIGREIRALGGNFFGGVCINLLRHPAWGRAQESYGEDSFHLGMMGAALATGVQNHVLACVKHFALNSMENARTEVDVTADARTLHEVYLAHFKRVVDAGVASLMTSYNSVNGEWAGQNRVLITDILKDMWGFTGFTVTDFIVGMRDARTAALAGQDVEMPFGTIYRAGLKALVESGAVPESAIDNSALRMLRQLVRFGQGRNAADYTRNVVGSAAHRAIAREAAEKSIVLLKNEGGLLPLQAKGSLAVIGRLAAVPNTGDGGSSMTHPDHVVTPLEGLTAALGKEAVSHDDGSDVKRAAAAAGKADAALVVVGFTHADEGEFIPPNQLQPYAYLFPPPADATEKVQSDNLTKGMGNSGFSTGGDRARLTLRPEDEALIAAVAAANPRTIVAVMAGSAVIMEAWRHKVPAILMLWYPGQEGGHALADILLGKVNPSGRLPCTFPASADQLPFFDRDATRSPTTSGTATGSCSATAINRPMPSASASAIRASPTPTCGLPPTGSRPTQRWRRRSTSPIPARSPATTSCSSTSPASAPRSSERRASSRPSPASTSPPARPRRCGSACPRPSSPGSTRPEAGWSKRPTTRRSSPAMPMTRMR